MLYGDSTDGLEGGLAVGFLSSTHALLVYVPIGAREPISHVKDNFFPPIYSLVTRCELYSSWRQRQEQRRGFTVFCPTCRVIFYVLTCFVQLFFFCLFITRMRPS